jgi:hypothetical protein
LPNYKWANREFHPRQQRVTLTFVVGYYYYEFFRWLALLVPFAQSFIF